MYSSGLSRDRYSLESYGYSVPNYQADSRSFIPSDLIPIALIRDPGFVPHIPHILFWVPAFPVISPHVSSSSYLRTWPGPPTSINA